MKKAAAAPACTGKRVRWNIQQFRAYLWACSFNWCAQQIYSDAEFIKIQTDFNCHKLLSSHILSKTRRGILATFGWMSELPLSSKLITYSYSIWGVTIGNNCTMCLFFSNYSAFDHHPVNFLKRAKFTRMHHEMTNKSQEAKCPLQIRSLHSNPSNIAKESLPPIFERPATDHEIS